MKFIDFFFTGVAYGAGSFTGILVVLYVIGKATKDDNKDA